MTPTCKNRRCGKWKSNTSHLRFLVLQNFTHHVSFFLLPGLPFETDILERSMVPKYDFNNLLWTLMTEMKIVTSIMKPEFKNHYNTIIMSTLWTVGSILNKTSTVFLMESNIAAIITIRLLWKPKLLQLIKCNLNFHEVNYFYCIMRLASLYSTYSMEGKVTTALRDNDGEQNYVANTYKLRSLFPIQFSKFSCRVEYT